ncbi:hypothetical protein NL676_039268 [Syzygium grande]|nr:hypothetical protein NL676_039268 [Syzygium grande]
MMPRAVMLKQIAKRLGNTNAPGRFRGHPEGDEREEGEGAGLAKGSQIQDQGGPNRLPAGENTWLGFGSSRKNRLDPVELAVAMRPCSARDFV